ncbi:uncharacterized protein At3g06530-like [Impatiens glandulifera]|uniref:uncharacterized protein At3g06530-like n=1 Tax=Impatiens glandulifera TaxID=253017 RepID=UPI001FB159BF|nr:uncharacterized protein At3g06530-like [Impatiens glandulifera]
MASIESVNGIVNCDNFIVGSLYYISLNSVPSELSYPAESLRLKQSSITSFNKDTVRRFAETVSLDLAKYMPWPVENCNSSEFSKTLFFLVLLDSSMEQKIDDVQFHALHDACYPILKTGWNLLDSTGEVPNLEL